jgi:flagellar hook-associated protein 1 FlgK
MLDVFAATFADKLNAINNTDPSSPPAPPSPALFTTNDGVTTTGITAGNISVSSAWYADAGTLTKTSASAPLGEENDKILAMIQLFNDKTIDFDGASVSGPTVTTYTGGIVSFHPNLGITLGIDKSTVSNLSATYKLNVENLDSYRQSVSGVDENEEAANMLMYQKAYSAAARILTAMDEMLDLLVNRLGTVGR